MQGNAAAAQLGALNMNPAYRNLAPQQLTASQQQQLLLQQGLNPSQVSFSNHFILIQPLPCLLKPVYNLHFVNLIHSSSTRHSSSSFSEQGSLEARYFTQHLFWKIATSIMIMIQGGVANLQSAVNMAALMRPQAAQQSRFLF